MGGRITDPEEQQLEAYGGASGEHHKRGGVEETTCGVQRGECQNEEKGRWKAVAMKEESCNIMYMNCGIIDIVEGRGGEGLNFHSLCGYPSPTNLQHQQILKYSLHSL